MKVKIIGHIDYKKCKYTGKDEYRFHNHDMSDCRYFKVMDHQFEVEIPDDFGIRPQQIASLKEHEKKASADFEQLRADIQIQISDLEALEFLSLGKK